MASIYENEKVFNNEYSMFNIRKILNDVIKNSSMYFEVTTSFQNDFYFFLNTKNNIVTIDYIEIPKKTFLEDMKKFIKILKKISKLFLNYLIQKNMKIILEDIAIKEKSI